MHLDINIRALELNHNQLAGCNLFFGYHKAQRHDSANFYLLGNYMKVSIINLHATYNTSKQYLNFVKNLASNNGKMWLIHEDSDTLNRCFNLRSINSFFRNLFVYKKDWIKGTLSNFKKIRIIKRRKFPNAIFVPNAQHNYYIINESFIKQIPSFCLSDTFDNMRAPFLAIPANSRDFRGLLYFYYMTMQSYNNGLLSKSSDFIFHSINKTKSNVLVTKSFSSILENIDRKSFFYACISGFLHDVMEKPGPLRMESTRKAMKNSANSTPKRPKIYDSATRYVVKEFIQGLVCKPKKQKYAKDDEN